MRDAEDASKFFTTIVTEMFESDEEETQLHALNLLFNLSVHFNLSEDMTIIDFQEGLFSIFYGFIIISKYLDFLDF